MSPKMPMVSTLFIEPNLDAELIPVTDSDPIFITSG